MDSPILLILLFCSNDAVQANLSYTSPRTPFKEAAVSVIVECIRLRDSVATVNTQLGAGHVARSIGEEEGDGTHKVLRLAHLALRNEGDPLLGELRVVVEDLLGAVEEDRLAICHRKHMADENLQSSEHVTRRDAVDTNACVCPLDGERRSHVTDSGLSGVVGSLRLRDVDNGTAHGSDHDNATGCLALHEVLGNTDGEEPGTVNVDTP
jgi:hypothetical protein